MDTKSRLEKLKEKHLLKEQNFEIQTIIKEKEIKLISNNIMTYQQANILVDYSDYIYPISPSIMFKDPVQAAYLEKIFINGSRELAVPSDENIIEFFTMVNGVLSTAIQIDLSKTQAENITAITTGSGIEVDPISEKKFKAKDLLQSLQLQFYQKDFLILSKILGLDSPDGGISDQVVVYQINSFDSLFPRDFNFEVGSDSLICQISLGFSDTFIGLDFSDFKQIEITMIVQSSFQVGSSFNSEPIIINSVCCVPIGQLENFNEIKYVRIKFNEPTSGELLKFANPLNIGFLFKSL